MHCSHCKALVDVAFGFGKPVSFGQCSLEIVWSRPASPPVAKCQRTA